ncbi:MAG: hypothetical protein J6R47_05560 [Acholeplasmatales bacterium]|nr:hypothetical protein [Acholeplasmatales bacterium]
MTAQLNTFLQSCKQDLTQNDITSVLNKCPKSLRPELLELLDKQGIKTEGPLTDIIPLDVNQWVAFWPKGRFASLSPEQISVIQLKDIPAFEEAAYSVVLQGDRGATKIQRYKGYYYKYEDLKNSNEFNSQELDRKNYQKNIDKEVLKTLNPFKNLIKEYFPDTLFKDGKFRNSVYFYAYPKELEGIYLLAIGTMNRTPNNSLYKIELSELHYNEDEEDDRKFYYSTALREENKTKKEVETLIRKQCKEVKDVLENQL